MSETIFLTPPKKKSARQRSLEKHPVLTRTLEATAVIEAGILAGLLGKPSATLKAFKSLPGILGKQAPKLIPKTLKGKATALAGVGALSVSPKLRQDVIKLPKKIYTGGKKLGEIYEEPSKASDVLGLTEKKTAKEKIIQGAKTAGVAGAVIAGAVVAKKALEKKKAEKIEQVKQLPSIDKELGFTDPQPVGIGGRPVAVSQPLTPSQAPQSQIPFQPNHTIIQIQI